METAKILVVEDDADINGLLTAILKKQGYGVTSAFSGSEAGLCLQNGTYQLVLLDLMLPGITGETLIEQIRGEYTMPILVISAKGQEDKLKVLRMGADDFISKPFDVEEVIARVQAQLRRYTQFSIHKQEAGKLRFKQMTLDTDAREVRIQGKRVAFTSHEFDILKLLMMYPRKVFTRENLFQTVWGEAYYGDDNTINVHISNIRSKIAQQDPGREYIKTVWGVGFKMSDD